MSDTPDWCIPRLEEWLCEQCIAEVLENHDNEVSLYCSLTDREIDSVVERLFNDELPKGEASIKAWLKLNERGISRDAQERYDG